MGFPESNLPPLDGQRYYTLVHQLSSNPAERAYRPCERHGMYENVYYGFSVSILHPTRKDILADARHISYTVYLEGEEYKVNYTSLAQGRIVLPSEEQDTLSHKFIRATQAAFQGSIQPTRQLGAIYDLLNTMYTENISNSVARAAKAIMQQLTIERGASSMQGFERIDEKHVQLMLTHEQQQVPKRHIYAMYINNTYVNIVHDCERMCIQSVLSDNSSFMSEQNIDNYGLLCAHKLLGAREQKDALNALQHVRHRAHKPCNACTLSATNITINALVVAINAAALFITFNNSQCATAVRSHISRIANIFRGTHRLDQTSEISAIEEIDDAHKVEVS